MVKNSLVTFMDHHLLSRMTSVLIWLE